MLLLPKIALVGRPNVGKSALFNRICQKRLSIVDEEEGITFNQLDANFQHRDWIEFSQNPSQIHRGYERWL